MIPDNILRRIAQYSFNFLMHFVQNLLVGARTRAKCIPRTSSRISSGVMRLLRGLGNLRRLREIGN